MTPSKILSLILIISVALAMLSCDVILGGENTSDSIAEPDDTTKKPEGDATTEPENPIEPEKPAKPEKPTEPDKPADVPGDLDGLAIVWDGYARYRVVYGVGESSEVLRAVKLVLDAIEAQSGVRPACITDDVPYDESIKEIIVGKNNNRPATGPVNNVLGKDSLCYSTYAETPVISGDTDVAVIAAAEYFVQKYVIGERGSLVVPCGIHAVIPTVDWHTENYDKTESLKHSYSDYISSYTEHQLISFSAGESNYGTALGGYIDSHSIDGNGALRWDLKGENETLVRILTDKNGSFLFNAADKNKSTVKLWLYVGDTNAVVCDHDAISGFQENQATFYFRAVDKNGRTHCWNHTITNNGWQEIELSFNIHNGVDSGFDYANITGFWVGLFTYRDVTVMIDNMRGVTYSTDYTPEAIEGEENPRHISDCEYNALDGAIIQEWYGASYDLEDKMQGSSSLRNYGDASVSDFRTIIANLDIEMDRNRDELVFYIKISTPDTIASFFIELNQVQDSHEISAFFTLDELRQYGYSGERDSWCEIRIPLSAFNVQLDPSFGDAVRLHNFRFCANATGEGRFEYNIDRIYLAEK